MPKAKRQMPARAGRAGVARGEAACQPASDEAAGPRCGTNGTGNPHATLLHAAFTRENLQRALKRVRANKGAAGVDGLDIDQTARHLVTAWPAIREQLLAGTYRPSPVRRVMIPKPDGSQRELGIPTVVDRLIQQALLQVLQPMLDPEFSEHSYGFRPGRRAQDAVLAAQAYVQSGRRVVVDVDLEKFFDRVNHDILIDRLRQRIEDAGVIRLIRAYLNSGIMSDGVVQERHLGTPQGGPLSPLLANVLLDEVDRELERKGHKFVRYADDCNVYVKSRRAGQRVLDGLRARYAKLRLKVNETKTAVAPVWGRKFLGYSLWVSLQGHVRLAVAGEAVQRYKQRIRQMTRRQTGRSMSQIAQDLQAFLPGWKAYFQLAQTHRVWRGLDEWMRRRLRAVQLKFWRRGPTMFRELRALGATRDIAAQIAGNARRWWYNSSHGLNRVLTIAHFDHLGVPRLC